MKLQTLSKRSWETHVRFLSPDDRRKLTPRPASRLSTRFEWKVKFGGGIGFKNGAGVYLNLSTVILTRVYWWESL